jgi:hypothetical protein
MKSYQKYFNKYCSMTNPTEKGDLHLNPNFVPTRV